MEQIMSFYANQKDEFIESSTKGIKLHLKYNLADFPKANIIIAHGVAEHLGRYDQATSFLNKIGFNVFRYDQRGHGKSEGTRGYIENYNNLSGDLDKVVDLVHKNYFNFSTFILGHSMGGETVLLYGTQYPGKIDGILATDALSLYTKPTFGKVPIAGDPKKTVPNTLNGLDSDQRVFSKYKADKQNQKTLTVGIINAMYKGALYLRKNISKISDPIFLMHGNEDGAISVLDTLKAFPKIGSHDKELHVYPCLMHEILNEPTRKWDIYKEISGWINKRIY